MLFLACLRPAFWLECEVQTHLSAVMNDPVVLPVTTAAGHLHPLTATGKLQAVFFFSKSASGAMTVLFEF